MVHPAPVIAATRILQFVETGSSKGSKPATTGRQTATPARAQPNALYPSVETESFREQNNATTAMQSTAMPARPSVYRLFVGMELRDDLAAGQPGYEFYDSGPG